eukprot:3940844-Rhodomonas_salina.8
MQRDSQSVVCVVQGSLDPLVSAPATPGPGSDPAVDQASGICEGQGLRDGRRWQRTGPVWRTGRVDRAGRGSDAFGPGGGGVAERRKGEADGGVIRVENGQHAVVAPETRGVLKGPRRAGGDGGLHDDWTWDERGGDRGEGMQRSRSVGVAEA